jgi:hypothetical protein
MLIPLIVGKNSNAEDQQIDLSDIGLLMISYCDELSVKAIFQQLYKTDYPYKSLNYLIANTRRLKQWQINKDFGIVYLRDEPEEGNIATRKKIFKKVTDEIERRERILKSKKIKDFKRYISLNLWNDEKITYQFLLIDDVWDIVTTKPKSLGIDLIRILLYGPAVGVHTIIASAISYRNLLQQLVKINPTITSELQLKYGIPEPKQIGIIGSELIFSPDGLVFYRPAGSFNLEKYYPVNH